MRITNLGIFSRDVDVAQQRNCCAEADSMAIDPRGDLLVTFQQ